MTEYSYDELSYEAPAENACDCAPAPIEPAPITEAVAPEPVVEEPPIAIEAPIAGPAQLAPAAQPPVDAPAAPTPEPAPTGALTSFSADPGSEGAGAMTSFSADPGSAAGDAVTTFSADPSSQEPGPMTSFSADPGSESVDRPNTVMAHPDAVPAGSPYGRWVVPPDPVYSTPGGPSPHGAFNPFAADLARSDWMYNLMHDRQTQGYQEDGIRYRPDGTPS